MEKPLIIICLSYILYLLIEKKKIAKKLKSFKYVIHVNGIRGKSSVCRMIDAGVRKGNYKVFTKITGTSPRIINTKNSEIEIVRLGKPNIKEQMEAINLAYKEGAEILILECMAVDPYLQMICEEKIIKSNIGVITNVRYDHLDVMGKSLDKIAKSLSNTIPTDGILFVGDKKFYKFFEEVGNKRNTKVTLSDTFKLPSGSLSFEENYSIVFELCKYMGISEELVIQSFDEYKRDPGSLKVYLYSNINNNKIFFINAMAANDPDSSQIILEKILEKYEAIPNKYLMINNRIDRANRMEQFVDFVVKNEINFTKILVSGSPIEIFRKKLINKGISIGKIEILSNISSFDKYSGEVMILATGNICGYGEELVDKIAKKGEIVYAV